MCREVSGALQPKCVAVAALLRRVHKQAACASTGARHCSSCCIYGRQLTTVDASCKQRAAGVHLVDASGTLLYNKKSFLLASHSFCFVLLCEGLLNVCSSKSGSKVRPNNMQLTDMTLHGLIRR